MKSTGGHIPGKMGSPPLCCVAFSVACLFSALLAFELLLRKHTRSLERSCARCAGSQCQHLPEPQGLPWGCQLLPLRGGELLPGLGRAVYVPHLRGGPLGAGGRVSRGPGGRVRPLLRCQLPRDHRGGPHLLEQPEVLRLLPGQRLPQGPAGDDALQGCGGLLALQHPQRVVPPTNILLHGGVLIKNRGGGGGGGGGVRG